MRVDSRTLERLVALGQVPALDDCAVPPEFEDLVSNGRVLHALSPTECQAFPHQDTLDGPCGTLDDACALFKALVIIARLRNNRESVGTAISLYHVIERGNETRGRELADWALPRTTNPHIPFGLNNLGAPSWTEFQLQQFARSFEQGVRARRHDEQQAAARNAAEEARRARAVAYQARCAERRSRPDP